MMQMLMSGDGGAPWRHPETLGIPRYPQVTPPSHHSPLPETGLRPGPIDIWWLKALLLKVWIGAIAGSLLLFKDVTENCYTLSL